MLLDIQVENEEIYFYLCELLQKIGQSLESKIKDVELYITGMLKLGRNLEWFNEFKTLDDAFDRLKGLSMKTTSNGLKQKLEVRRL